MWYFDLLKPYHDHVPVKADLSDLEEKIRWCREHDDDCRKIGENAKEFYEKYVARSALLDYLEVVCKNVAKRYLDPPRWWSAPPKELPPPKLRKPDVPCYEDRATGQSRLCVRCQEDRDAELRELEEAQKNQETKKVDAATKRKNYRARMLDRAKKRARTDG